MTHYSAGHSSPLGSQTKHVSQELLTPTQQLVKTEDFCCSIHLSANIEVFTFPAHT